MKRKQLIKKGLAVALSAAMAFSMAPEVGLLSVPANVKAAISSPTATLLSFDDGDGEGSDYAFGSNAPGADRTLKSTGGEEVLPMNIDFKNTSKVFAGWKIGDDLYADNNIWKYTDAEYGTGAVAVAQWRIPIEIGTSDLSSLKNSNNNNKITKAFDGTSEWTGEINKTVKIILKGHYDLSSTAAQYLTIDSVEFKNAADADNYKLIVNPGVLEDKAFSGAIVDVADISIDSSKLSSFEYNSGFDDSGSADSVDTIVRAALKGSDASLVTAAVKLNYCIKSDTSSDGYEAVASGYTAANKYYVFIDKTSWDGAHAGLEESRPVDPIGSFTITPKNLSSADIEVAKISASPYTGAKIEPGLTIKDTPTKVDGTKFTSPYSMVSSKDYVVKYSNNVNTTKEAIATITGKGNYVGTKTVTFEIQKTGAKLEAPVYTNMPYGEDVSSSSYKTTLATTGVSSLDKQIKYYYIKGDDKNITSLEKAKKATGWTEESKTEFTVGDWYAKAVLEETENYTGDEVYAASSFAVTRKSLTIPVDAGVISTKGKKEDDKLSISLAEAIEAENLGETLDLSKLTIDTLTDDNSRLKSGTFAISGSAITYSYGDLGTFTSGKSDITILSNALNGENYAVTFKVTATLLNKNDSVVEPELTIADSVFGEDPTTISAPVVKVGGVTVDLSDAPITYYSRNLNTGVLSSEGSTRPTHAGVYIAKTTYTGTGEYGEASVEFVVSPFPVTVKVADTVYDASVKDANYNRLKSTFAATITPENLNDKATPDKVAEVKDYPGDSVQFKNAISGLTIEVYDKDEIAVDGTLDGVYDFSLDDDEVDKIIKDYPDLEITFDLGTLTVTGNNNKVADIADAVVAAIPDQTYTGEAITPTVTVTFDGVVLVAGTDYDVEYTDNINVGTAKITITGKGSYTGTKTVSFNITDEENKDDAAKKAAAEAAQKYIEAAAALPQSKDAVTDTTTADSAIAAAKALAPTEAQMALLDDETKAKVAGAATQIANAEKAVADKKADNNKENEKTDDTTTGSSTDVTPSGSGSGGSGGGGGSSNAKTVKNADGSTTTTTTTAKGTIETTTKTNADGSKTTSKVVKNKDGSGSVTETSVSAAGTTKVVEVVTDTTGAATEVTTTVSNSKGASMKVTYAAKGTAITVSKVETTGKTAVSIPATVKVGGKTYKVTKIAASALKGNKEITKVTLGANVKSIGKNAFNGDSKLKTIVMKKAPTTVGKNAFKGIAKKATIKIKATKKAFKTAKKLIKKSGVASTVKIKRTK